MPADIAILGAGGGTGQKCVEKLLAQQKGVKAVVRDATKYKQTWPANDKLVLVNGDVTDTASLESALQGVKGIVFAVSASSYFGANAVDKDVRHSSLFTISCVIAYINVPLASVNFDSFGTPFPSRASVTFT